MSKSDRWTMIGAVVFIILLVVITNHRKCTYGYQTIRVGNMCVAGDCR